MNKFLKLANYFDSQGFYKSADAIESFVKKAQNNSFADKQPDLAKIEQSPSNKIANDIVYYAASVSQGTKTPSYDPRSFFTTIQKIESMKMNPDVQNNFPNIYNSLDAAIELLKSKSVGETPSSPPQGENILPKNPNEKGILNKPPFEDPIFGAGPRKEREDIKFIRKTYIDLKRFAEYDIPRWKRKLELLDPEKDSKEIKHHQQIINNYLDLINKNKLILENPAYKKAVDYLVRKGEISLEEVESEASSGDSGKDASKILDEAFPTYSSRPSKPDNRLPGFSNDFDKARIYLDYENKFPYLDRGTKEKDPAGGPKLSREQLDAGVGIGGRSIQLPEGYEALGKPFFGRFDKE
jgi:hypothetical protein